MPYRNKKTGKVISDEEYQKTIQKQIKPTKGLTFAEISQETQEAMKKGEEAKEFLKKPWYKQLLPSKFAPSAGEVMKEVFVDPSLKVAKAGLETPETILRGGKTPTITREALTGVPFLGKTKSYIQEQEERVPQIIEGEKPLWTAALPFAEIPLSVAEVFMYTKGLTKLSPSVWKVAKNIITRESKKFTNVLELVSNPIIKKEATQAIMRAGRPGGVKVKGIIRKKPVIKPTSYEQEIAKTVRPFYNKNPFKFAEKINKGIETEAKSVSNFLTKNKVDYNPDELLAKIDAIEPPALITPENATAVQRAKNIAKDVITSSENNNVALWEVRKTLDNMFENAKSGVLDPDRVASINLVVRRVRKTINNHIAEITKGGQQFTSQMKKMSNMYSALDEIADKNYRVLIQVLKEKPLLKRMLKKGLRYAGYGVAGAVGGTIAGRIFRGKPKY